MDIKERIAEHVDTCYVTPCFVCDVIAEGERWRSEWEDAATDLEKAKRKLGVVSDILDS